METSEQVSGTILVVDDDEGVRKVLTRWVTDMGYAVKAAESADQALEIMREGDVDVALCDVRMPGHDGIWLLDQIRRFHPDIASVLATGLLEMDPAWSATSSSRSPAKTSKRSSRAGWRSASGCRPNITRGRACCPQGCSRAT